MLELIEKIVHGFCGLIILIVGSLYVFFPTPTTTPREFIPATTIANVPPPPPPPVPGDDKPAPVAPTTDDLRSREAEVRKKLIANGVRRTSEIKLEWATVPKAQFEIVKNKSNWAPEMNLAQSRVLDTKNGPTRLQITRIDPNSYLRKVAQLEDGDIVELIDGEALQYNDRSASQYWSLAEDLIGRLAEGGAITLTVTRGNETLHREFRVAR